MTYNGYVTQIANMGVFQTSLVAGVVTPIGAIMLAMLDALYVYIVWNNLRIAKVF